MLDSKRSPYARQQGMSIIGLLLLLVILGFMAIVAMKIIPMYINYHTVKSTIDNIRKDPNIGTMTPEQIHESLQKRFDIGFVNHVKAKDLPIKGKTLHLTYDEDQELFYGLHAVLRVNETIPLVPKK